MKKINIFLQCIALFTLVSCAGSKTGIVSYGGSFEQQSKLYVSEKAAVIAAESEKATQLNEESSANTRNPIPVSTANVFTGQNQIQSASHFQFENEPLVVKPEKAQKIATKNSVLHKNKKAAEKGGKSQIIALLLVFFLGALGIHRFYLGYIGIGIIQLITLGGFGIWAFIDFIRIITGGLKPKDGDYDETL